MDRRRELASVLFRKANEDLAMARRLAGDPQTPEWGIGFHAQQAVEKAIKAVLALKGIEYPRTHDIAVVIDLLSENGVSIPPDHTRLVQLTPFGALLRYDEMGPSDDEIAAVPDREALLSMANAAIVWAQGILGTRS